VINCTFAGNDSNGVELQGRSLAKFTNCTIVGNGAYGIFGGYPTVTNCSIVGNVLSAIASYTPKVSNCILWDNAAGDELGQQIIDFDGRGSVTYSNVQGGWAGSGNNNIAVDPCFVDTDGSDNVVGTEDDNLRLFSGSPCIDEGNNMAVPADIADLDNDGNTGERTPLDLDCGQRFADDPCTPDSGVADPPDYVEVVDVGAYEYRYYSNTCWDAAVCVGQASGDATCDGNVNLADLFALKAGFGSSAPWTAPQCCADFNHNDLVDLGDLFILKAGFGTSGYSPSTGSQACPP
jgi:hypothetical protein